MKALKMSLLIILICNAVNAYEFSGIDIVNVVGSFPGNHYDAIHTSLWDVSDGLDSRDMVIYNNFCFCIPEWPGYLCEVASMYSDVNGHKCLYDYRPCDSNAPFDIKLFLCGSVGGDTENHLEVDFYVRLPEYETFDDKTVILESDRLLYGRAVDVRRIIEIGRLRDPKTAGIIPLKKVPAGNHTIANPYGEMTLKIGTSLADINSDGKVNLKDYTYIAEHYGESGFGIVGDISGFDGVPDGCVDYADISAFAKEYLWE